jgi:hypothetical protein
LAFLPIKNPIKVRSIKGGAYKFTSHRCLHFFTAVYIVQKNLKTLRYIAITFLDATYVSFYNTPDDPGYGRESDRARLGGLGRRQRAVWPPAWGGRRRLGCWWPAAWLRRAAAWLEEAAAARKREEGGGAGREGEGRRDKGINPKLCLVSH